MPVHLALLSDGKVAAWDGFEAAVNSEHTWDPWTRQFDAIPTGRNLFCAGHITLTDGRLLVAGGHIQAYEGTKDTNLFTPSTNTWPRGAGHDRGPLVPDGDDAAGRPRVRGLRRHITVLEPARTSRCR